MCADSTCKKLLTDAEIRSILSSDPSLLEKYTDFKEKDKLESDVLVRFCVRPGCDGWERAKDDKVKKLTCKKCKQDMCFECKEAYHPK